MKTTSHLKTDHWITVPSQQSRGGGKCFLFLLFFPYAMGVQDRSEQVLMLEAKETYRGRVFRAASAGAIRRPI